ncbi:MAG TPA: TatD family hydrolase [Gemmatimonadales bacterium]|nr:TatD family hydrolase [Gemmatimonadales bacterium]
MLVDTHCHLGDAAFAGDRDAALDRAAAAGVGHVVVVGESPEAAAAALALAQADPRVSATAGIHPHIAGRWDAAVAAWLEIQLRDTRVVAAGEMGLDYHYDNAPRDRQRAAFEAQLALAARAGKPAIIHAREADDDVAAILANQPDAVAILHSFSGADRLLEAGIALGHFVSFSGMVTFRNWQRDDAIRRVPRDRLLVETDAPYLAPVPYRGKRNEPAFVVAVAERLAGVLDLPPEELARMTTQNAVRVFGHRIGKSD